MDWIHRSADLPRKVQSTDARVKDLTLAMEAAISPQWRKMLKDSDEWEIGYDGRNHHRKEIRLYAFVLYIPCFGGTISIKWESCIELVSIS